MIKTFLLFVTLISLSAEAKKSKKSKPTKKPPSHTAEFVTEERMESINLQGLQILDSSGWNEFRYQMKPLDKISPETENLIFEHSKNNVISRIYEVNQKAAFQNIYMYVAKAEDFPKAKYALTIVFKNLPYGEIPGTSYCSRYYITKGNAKSLVMYRYEKDSPRVAKNANDLFP